MVLFLSEIEVAKLLSMRQAIPLIEDAFEMFARKRIAVVPRLALNLGGEAGAFRAMMASVPDLGFFGLKTLTGIPGKRDPKNTYFALLLFDSTSGALAAIIAAGHLTVVRTGAAGGVAVKHLARSNSDSLGVLGTGIQARSQVAAVRTVLPIRRIKICSRRRDEAQNLANEYVREGLDATFSEDLKEVVTKSDVIVCATTAVEAVIHGDWIQDGTHVNAIGANSPGKRELDASAFAGGKVVVDLAEQVCLEAGDVIDALATGPLSRSHFQVELGDVLIGSKQGRTSASDITIFKSVGPAFLDIAVGAWIYKEARAQGLGRQIYFTA